MNAVSADDAYDVARSSLAGDDCICGHIGTLAHLRGREHTLLRSQAEDGGVALYSGCELRQGTRKTALRDQ